MSVNSTNRVRTGSLVSTMFAVLFILSMQVFSAPPSPALLERNAAGKVAMPYFITHLDEMHDKGICTGEQAFASPNTNAVAKEVHGQYSAAGTFKVLAILVKYGDHPSSVSASFFDNFLFGTTGSTVKNYYNEMSYAQIDLVTVNAPSSTGWQTAPQNYSYYVNGQNGTGAYPNNTQKMVEDLVDMVDPSVDFSQYDNDGNGFVDVLLVIHSGSGAEYSGSNNDIWSHKWGISPRLKDGVRISSFTVQPEYWSTPGDMTIGVYAHELAHGFGLPDLYDVDYTSKGIGKWCLMAGGTWNGTVGLGNSPAHPSAWCKKEMGLITPVNVMTNQLAESIATSTQNPVAYRLWTSGAPSNEYFLVENRQKVGYDSYLPGSGLMIWHIDESKSGNSQEWYPGQNGANHYLVALEQADGFYQLENNLGGGGDTGDPFPGSSNNTSFDAVSSPSSNSYLLGNSFVGVQNISASAMTMTADLIVGLSAGTGDEEEILPNNIFLSQNYPNPFNPTTTIQFTATRSAEARIDVYNLLGERVATLFDGTASVGDNSVIWNATNSSGETVASGVYFYTLFMNNEETTKKMLLVR